MLNDHVEGGKQLAASQAAARKETGLSEAEVTALSEVAGAVMVRNCPDMRRARLRSPRSDRGRAR